jgi:4a-hydroxytetrahydrobiopterin dehydratase
MTKRVRASEFNELGLDDWRVLRRRIEANFECGSFGLAGAFAAEVAEVCDAQDHHASIDLRYPDLVHVVSTTHFLSSLTERDVALARAISDLARGHGYGAVPRASSLVEVAIDALDIDAVLPFWEAVLNYAREEPDENGRVVDLYDLRDTGPPIWFQQMAEPRPQRNRMHLDITVPHDVAEQRIEAALAAGGRLVSDDHAKAFWVIADAEGNEACICTWQDRGN